MTEQFKITITFKDGTVTNAVVTREALKGFQLKTVNSVKWEKLR